LTCKFQTFFSRLGIIAFLTFIQTVKKESCFKKKVTQNLLQGLEISSWIWNKKWYFPHFI